MSGRYLSFNMRVCNRMYLRVGLQRHCSQKTENLDLKSKIIDGALKNVPLLGWSDDSLVKSTVDLGLPPLSHKIVERGPVEIVEFFLKNKRNYVAIYLENMKVSSEEQADSDASKFSRVDFLRAALNANLDYIYPYKSSWPSAIALLSDPQQILRSTQIAADTIDELTVHVGIDATRMDWYTERAALMAVYTSVELFMLQDESENLKESR